MNGQKMSVLTTSSVTFNLEANAAAARFYGRLFRKMKMTKRDSKSSNHAKNSMPILSSGILPTLQESIRRRNLTPQRDVELNRLTGCTANTARFISKAWTSPASPQNFLEFQMSVLVICRSAQRFCGLQWARRCRAGFLAAAAIASLILGHRLWHEPESRVCNTRR